MAGPNLYDLFFAEDGTTQAQALAEALRRRRGEGELVALTGSRKLAPFAQTQLRAAEQGDQQLAAAGQEAGGNRLRKALQASQQQFQGAEGAKDRALRRSLAEMEQRGANARAGAGMRANALERAVERLGKDMEGQAQLDADLQFLEGVVSGTGDIPGAGILDSRLPGVLQSGADVDVRQAASRLAAALLHEQSGAAVTPSEAERFMAGRGLGPGATEEQFRKGVAALAKELRTTRQAKQAKYPEVVRKAYTDQGGKLAADQPASAATGTPEIAVTPDGKRYRRQPDGSYLPEG